MNSKVILVLTLHLFAQTLAAEFIKKLHSPEWQCKAFCADYGAKSDFDKTSNICRCLQVKNSANENMKMKEIRLKSIKKRETAPEEVAAATQPQIVEIEQPTTICPDPTTIPSVNPEGIVGQSHNKKLHSRIVAQRRQRGDARPITPEQQRVIMQQMREHMNRLGQTTDQKARQVELDAIRSNLRQLSQSVVVPQQRSRFRNVVEEARKRQRLRGTVGAPKAKTLNKDRAHVAHENEVEEAVKEIKMGHPHFEVITQDPKLVDE